MALFELLILGAIAGFTIYLGLPILALASSVRAKSILNAVTIGILIFLLVDIMTDAMDLSQQGIFDGLVGKLSFVDGMAFPVVLFVGLVVGLLSLVWFESRYVTGTGGGKITDEARARRLALMIAIGIGLHNFSEGLAIGQSYASGVVHLAITLVVGFGLHNMTEGFSIAAPLSKFKPDWRYLALLGLIGGGPTFIGAIVGSFWVSDLVSVLFLSLAGGAIIYVIKELFYHGRVNGEGIPIMASVIIGFMMGFATLVLVHYWYS